MVRLEVNILILDCHEICVDYTLSFKIYIIAVLWTFWLV